MQTNQFSLKKSVWLSLLVVSAFSFLSISSCKEEPPKGSCISLSKSEIEKAWGDYIKKGEIEYLSFVTFYNPINHEINVSVQAFKKNDSAIGPFVKLLTESGCADSLPKVAVGENIGTLADLEILTESGRDLKDFAYLALTPYSEQGYLAYKVKVVDKSEKTLSTAAAGTLPCPPCINCRPPCEPDCLPACPPEPEDSLKNSTNAIIRDSINSK